MARKQDYIDSTGRHWVTMKKIVELSSVCPSSIRGYEAMGLFRQYGVEIIKIGQTRYFDPKQAHRIAQIQMERVSSRNAKLASYGNKNGYS